VSARGSGRNIKEAALKMGTYSPSLPSYLVGNLGAFHNIDRADARGKEGLVSVAHGGVGQQHALMFEHPGGDGFRALNEEGREGGKIYKGTNKLLVLFSLPPFRPPSVLTSASRTDLAVRGGPPAALTLS